MALGYRPTRDASGRKAPEDPTPFPMGVITNLGKRLHIPSIGLSTKYPVPGQRAAKLARYKLSGYLDKTRLAIDAIFLNGKKAAFSSPDSRGRRRLVREYQLTPKRGGVSHSGPVVSGDCGKTEDRY